MGTGLSYGSYHEWALDQSEAEFSDLKEACESLLDVLHAGSEEVLGEEQGYDFTMAIEEALGTLPPGYSIEKMDCCESWMVNIRDAVKKVVNLTEWEPPK